MSTAESRLHLPIRRREALAQKLNNAGSTYNAGNVLALVGAMIQVAIGSHGLIDTAQGIFGHLAGSLPALAASAASGAFLIGGVCYDAAWKTGAPPIGSKLQQGHALSALGALLMCLSLVHLSQSRFALVAALLAGGLHVTGKMGCLLDPKRDWFYKWLPLASRLPSTASLVSDGFLSLLGVALILCNLIWARADAMLMCDGPAKRALGRMLVFRT
jgi:hypothetical protein